MMKQLQCCFMVITFLSLNNIIYGQTPSNVSESTSVESSTTSNSETETKDVENSTTTPKQMTTENLPDIESLNKYRRNGIDIEYVDKWDDDRKRYMIEFANQFDDDVYPYRERARFNEKIFPVRIQGCPHYSRDVSRDEGFIRSGILQGWLGAAKDTNTRYNDDTRLDMSPFYVTTATPKTVPSYRNQASTNKQYGDYENNYDKQTNNYASTKPKYNSNYRVKSSSSRDYYNVQNGNYVNDRNVNSWQFPQGKNNRLIYYEYNLDNNRRPDSAYYPQTNDHFNYNHCDMEYDDNPRKPGKNHFNGDHYQSPYSGGLIPQSKLSTSFNQEQNDRDYGSYYQQGDAYQNKNLDRADNRNAAYEFNLPLNHVNNDKPHFSPPLPPTFTPQMQFVPESGILRQDKNDVKSVSYPGHRFNFQSNTQ